MDAPTSPQEAWIQAAKAAELKIEALPDEEILARLKAGGSDLLGMLVAEAGKRGLLSSILPELVQTLVDPEPKRGDASTYRYHYTCALMKGLGIPFTPHPSERTLNLEAMAVASDGRGEPHRQAKLREFWETMKFHLASQGTPLTWEPLWPTELPLYRYEEIVELRETSPLPSVRQLGDLLRQGHRDMVKCLKPETESFAITELVGADGTPIRRAESTSSICEARVSVVFATQKPDGEWVALPRLVFQGESNSASYPRTATPSMASALFGIRYYTVFDFPQKG